MQNATAEYSHAVSVQIKKIKKVAKQIGRQIIQRFSDHSNGNKDELNKNECFR